MADGPPGYKIIGQAERIAIRQSRVMYLRARGHKIEEIADIWNKEYPEWAVKRATIASDIKEMLDREVKEGKLHADQYRQLLIMRLDQALSADAFQKQIEKGSLLAIDRLIKLVERYAKLVGADMPTKIAQTDVTGERDISRMTDEERAARIQEILDRAEDRRVMTEDLGEQAAKVVSSA